MESGGHKGKDGGSDSIRCSQVLGQLARHVVKSSWQNELHSVGYECST